MTSAVCAVCGDPLSGPAWPRPAGDGTARRRCASQAERDRMARRLVLGQMVEQRSMTKENRMSEAMVAARRDLPRRWDASPPTSRPRPATLNLTIRPDWASRPALSVDEARGLASGEARTAPRARPGLGAALNATQELMGRAVTVAGRDAAEDPRPRRCVRRRAPSGRGASRQAAQRGRHSMPVYTTKSATCRGQRFSNGISSGTVWSTSPSRRHPHDRIRRRAGSRSPYPPAVWRSLLEPLRSETGTT